MSGKSNYLQKKLEDHVLGATVYTAPATVYLALFTVTPTAAGGGTEASGGSYARKAVTNNTTNWANATGASPAAKTNAASITMVQASADWSSAADQVAWGLFDASSAGNLLYWGPLTVAKPVLSGDTPTFAIGAISITET